MPYRFVCECGMVGPIRGSITVAGRDGDSHQFSSGPTWRTQHERPKIERVENPAAAVKGVVPHDWTEQRSAAMGRTWVRIFPDLSRGEITNLGGDTYWWSYIISKRLSWGGEAASFEEARHAVERGRR